MEIIRVHTYDDERFSQRALWQHGCFLIDNKEPYEVEILSEGEAVLSGKRKEMYEAVIEEFRFFAPHIYLFYDSEKRLIKKYPKPSLLEVQLKDIQPSQFYVDVDKLKAIETFVQSGADIIIQVVPYQKRYLSLDGHTRLYYAVKKGYTKVRAILSETDDCIYDFAEEAIRRSIQTPYDLILLNHDEYDREWNQYCNAYFEEKEKQDNGDVEEGEK